LSDVESKPLRGPLKISLAFDDAIRRIVRVKPKPEERPTKKPPKKKR
jgi:hypothetical protein